MGRKLLYDITVKKEGIFGDSVEVKQAINLRFDDIPEKTVESFRALWRKQGRPDPSEDEILDAYSRMVSKRATWTNQPKG